MQELNHDPTNGSITFHTVGGSAPFTYREIIQWGCHDIHRTLGTFTSLVHILHSVEAAQKIRSVEAMGGKAVTCKYISQASVFTRDSGE